MSAIHLGDSLAPLLSGAGLQGLCIEAAMYPEQGQPDDHAGGKRTSDGSDGGAAGGGGSKNTAKRLNAGGGALFLFRGTGIHPRRCPYQSELQKQKPGHLNVWAAGGTFLSQSAGVFTRPRAW